MQLVQITVLEPLNGDVIPITLVWAVDQLNSCETAGGRRIMSGRLFCLIPAPSPIIQATPIKGQPAPHQLQFLAEGGTNGKSIRSSRAFEEGTEKSTAGSPAVWCRARGFGKLTFKRRAHPVSRCS